MGIEITTTIIKEYCYLNKMEIKLNQPQENGNLGHIAYMLFEILDPDKRFIKFYEEHFKFKESSGLLNISDLSSSDLDSIKNRIFQVKQEQVGYEVI